MEDPVPYLKELGLQVDNQAPVGKLGAVILFDDDFWWNSERIAQVFNLLLSNPKLPLIIPNPDLIFPGQVFSLPDEKG